MITLQPSQEQHQLQEAVEAFLQEQMPLERLRQTEGLATADEKAMWQALGELGLFSIALPEDAGGSGGGIAEEILLFRELGRVAASPAAIATSVAAHLAWIAGDQELARRIAQGAEFIGLAVNADADAPCQAAGTHLQLIEAGDGLALIWDETGAGLVDCAQLIDRRPGTCIDWTIDLAEARFTEAAARLWVDRDVFDATGRIRLLTAAMLCGLAQGATDLGVEYVKVREQFGQPLGAFQAIKHRCADMVKRNLAAWSQTCFAALIHHHGGVDTAFQGFAASMLAIDAAILNADATIQNFGANGFTADTLVHFYLKRGHILDRVAGGAFWQHRAFMAEPNPVLAA